MAAARDCSMACSGVRVVMAKPYAATCSKTGEMTVRSCRDLSACSKAGRATVPSCGGLLEGGVGHDAVAGEAGGLDELVVPIDGQRLGVLVDQCFHKGVE